MRGARRLAMRLSGKLVREMVAAVANVASSDCFLGFLLNVVRALYARAVGM
tara:strand:+ start:476 stop:628 length:153 start_codon:yes stop_codon:yes gene_type:complete